MSVHKAIDTRIAQLQRRRLKPVRIWLSRELEVAFRAEIGRDCVHAEFGRTWRGVPIATTLAPQDEPRVVAEDGTALRLHIVVRRIDD